MNLASVRAQKGMSQEDVAKSSGIKRSSYTNIERGTRRPSVNVAKRIAKVLEIDWTELFEDKAV